MRFSFTLFSLLAGLALVSAQGFGDDLTDIEARDFDEGLAEAREYYDFDLESRDFEDLDARDFEDLDARDLEEFLEARDYEDILESRGFDDFDLDARDYEDLDA
ncbi:hypothetical protein CC1G_04836 [Coprinopsis cinerea okayama7|uniref:Uncharacterized protein n=1 Tax=Coprinopsis cinerea (strain Okayama-7 / 130 / ATCC MYA-4618 / FGSC 9003) TaxID=240176 RepID=A8PFR3_COPC7|nr:hypothetical protein CC1G_04836 [Coprinopsis cinerea okayama7\|eukprot:XP_001840992.1 hypothetical protein CC1G_04836 [Coprinopsis cinerea okayama7\